MRGRSIDISDETLGAYADEELSREERERVETALASDGELRRRLEAIRRIDGLVRAVVQTSVEAAVETPLPARGPPSPGRLARAFALIPGYGQLAASFAIGLVAALGVMLWLQAPHPTGGQWQQLTVALHQRFVDAMHAGHGFPLDVIDPDPERVDAFLAEETGYRPSIPDLSADAYVLTGARVMTTVDGPLVYALYTSSENPLLGLVVMRESEDSPDEAMDDAAVRLVSWRRGGARFAFVGTHSVSELERLAERYKDAVDIE